MNAKVTKKGKSCSILAVSIQVSQGQVMRALNGMWGVCREQKKVDGGGRVQSRIVPSLVCKDVRLTYLHRSRCVSWRPWKWIKMIVFECHRLWHIKHGHLYHGLWGRMRVMEVTDYRMILAWMWRFNGVRLLSWWLLSQIYVFVFTCSLASLLIHFSMCACIWRCRYNYAFFSFLANFLLFISHFLSFFFSLFFTKFYSNRIIIIIITTHLLRILFYKFVFFTVRFRPGTTRSRTIVYIDNS